MKGEDGTRQIIFQRHHGVYCPGDRVVRSRAAARDLVERGRARYAEPAAVPTREHVAPPDRSIVASVVKGTPADDAPGKPPATAAPKPKRRRRRS